MEEFEASEEGKDGRRRSTNTPCKDRIIAEVKIDGEIQ